jgi:polyisoprenyl-teichoic acid--peptidoglycan teichoic acid transferase
LAAISDIINSESYFLTSTIYFTLPGWLHVRDIIACEATKTAMNHTKSGRSSGKDASNRLVLVLLFAFVVAVLITGYLTYVFAKSVAASWGDSGRLGASAPLPGSTNGSNDTHLTDQPLQENGPESPHWDKEGRVTVLLMGLDSVTEGPPRSDSMILVSIDPTARSAGFLSIPRDLWVDIPGFEYGKINTAYFLGEAHRLPGGGPALSMQTVEKFLGLPVDFYIQINYASFENLIDEIGGIEVYVPEPLNIDPLGPNNSVDLEIGLHTLNGPLALAYARARNTAGSDYDRAERQQQVIMAVRDRILTLEMLPKLIEKSPLLYRQLASGLQTNLTLDQVISLAWIAQQIPSENIRRGVIGPDQVIHDVSFEGMYISRPIMEEIRLLRDEVFFFEDTITPVTVEEGDPEEMRQAENAQVSVLNGTFTPGLAAQTTEFLLDRGVNVVLTDNAQEVYEFTTLVDYSGKLYTRQYLVELLNILPSQVFSSYNPNSPVDIAIFLGKDWSENSP